MFLGMTTFLYQYMLPSLFLGEYGTNMEEFQKKTKAYL